MKISKHVSLLSRRDDKSREVPLENLEAKHLSVELFRLTITVDTLFLS